MIDDAIQFATVCLDKNKNGVCDAGEPSTKTDAAGKVSLQVDPADVGKFPILAVVGTDAVDAAYGPVTTAFTMTAPADQTTVVSPLTTLVQTTVANTGVSTAETAAPVQSQTGISGSLFQRFHTKHHARRPNRPSDLAHGRGQLTLTTATNWFVRGFTSSASQNTPDAANNIRYVDRRANSSGAAWNTGGSPNRQSDLHFTGTAWENCGLNGESVSSVRDTAGTNASNYCNNLERSKSNRATFDVSGKTMTSVITDARAAGYTNISIGNNSATALTAELGTTTFAAGSSIFYQASTSLTNAPAYYPGVGNRVFESYPTVAAGRTDSAFTAPCISGTPAATEAATLEGLIAARPGTLAAGSSSFDLQPRLCGARRQGLLWPSEQVGVFNSARLNLAGGNALLTRLRIGAVDPETPLALTKASNAGDWQVSDAATPTGSTLLRIFSNGTTSCTDTDATNPAAVIVSPSYACILNFSNLASGSFTFKHPTVATFSLTGTLDFLTGSASGTFVDGATTGTFVGARR